MEENIEEVNGINQKTGTKTGVIIAIIVSSLVFLIAGLATIIMFTIFSAKSQLVRACKSTIDEFVEESTLINVFDMSDIVGDGEYTVSLDIDTEIAVLGDCGITSSIGVKGEDVQLKGNIDLAYVPIIDYIIGIDSEYVKANISLIDEYLFKYNYREENDGFLMSYIDSYVVNDLISEIYGNVVNPTDYNSLMEDVSNDFDIKDINIYSARSKEFDINNKKVTCKGYKVSVSEEMISRIEERLNSGFKDSLPDVLKIDKDKRELIVYLYKNEIAGIEYSSEGGYVEVLLQGGSYRAQNLEILLDGRELLSIHGSESEGIETTVVKYNEEILFSYDYDENKDTIKIVIPYDWQEYTIDLKYTKRKSEEIFEIGYVDLGDTYVGGTITVSDGAQIDDISGAEIDLGRADESEIQNIISNMYKIVSELIGW